MPVDNADRAATLTFAVDGLPMSTSGAAYRKVPCALEAEEKQSDMVARPTSATFAAPPFVSRMLLVLTSLPVYHTDVEWLDRRHITRTCHSSASQWHSTHEDPTPTGASIPPYFD